jgi:hypothetical protein
MRIYTAIWRTLELVYGYFSSRVSAYYCVSNQEKLLQLLANFTHGVHSCLMAQKVSWEVTGL